MRGLDRVIATLFIQTHMIFVELDARGIFANTLHLFPGCDQLAVLQCRASEVWAREFSSTMGDGLRYSVENAFGTYPFANGLTSIGPTRAISAAYQDHRATLMIARNEGLTKTYNRFHDPAEHAPDIQLLRDLHHRVRFNVVGSTLTPPR